MHVWPKSGISMGPLGNLWLWEAYSGKRLARILYPFVRDSIYGTHVARIRQKYLGKVWLFVYGPNKKRHTFP